MKEGIGHAANVEVAGSPLSYPSATSPLRVEPLGEHFGVFSQPLLPLDESIQIRNYPVVILFPLGEGALLVHAGPIP